MTGLPPVSGSDDFVAAQIHSLVPPHTFDGSVNQWCNYRGPFGAKCGKSESDPIHGKERNNA